MFPIGRTLRHSYCKPNEAAAEFHRVVDHRALAPDSPYIALAALNLDRAGDRNNAAISYQNTQNIWKDADPDFVPLRQLKCLRSSPDTKNPPSLCFGHS